MNLSIVIPVYNSEKIIPTLVKSIQDNLSNFKNSFEIILVNDCSKDNSWGIIDSLSKKNNFVKGIDLKKNYGQHSAIFTGLKFCSGDKIICMDDDMQHNPVYIINIYNELNKGFDVCYVKYLDRQHKLFTIFISWLNNIISSYLMNKPIGIYTSSFKGINHRIRNCIIKNSSKYIFLDYLILKVKPKIQTINVKHNKRFSGVTNYKFKQLITLWSKMIFLIEIDKKNLRFFIIKFFRYLFVTWFQKYLQLENTDEIEIKVKTF